VTQATLHDFEAGDLSTLTTAEREVFVAVERSGRGVREYARQTDRSPGTVSNLLRRARSKTEGST
jgi:DNA-directed RNA polymerase specialized sigma24 family protein